MSRPSCRRRVAEAGLGRRPVREGLLDLPRSQGRPAAAGFAGRFAVLDTATGREKIWLAIGAAAGVWPWGHCATKGHWCRACRDPGPSVVEPVETTPPATPTPDGDHRRSSLSRPPCRRRSPKPTVWAADPFLRVFSTRPGVKDGLRPPATPAASRSWTPRHVEKRFGWLSGRRPECARGEMSPWRSNLSRPPNPQTLARAQRQRGGHSGHLPSTDSTPRFF